MKKIELLSPAGSIESMKSAICAGADAVYIGGPRFGARAYAENPDNEGLLSALDFCHFHGKKMYLTVNTLLTEKELNEELFDYLLPLYKEGLDAVIVQDYGVLRFVREHFPELPIHASTQMAVSSYFGAKLLENAGVSRVILPRELSLEDIKDINDRCHIETECFVHGALCYSYSGQCLMSSIIGGRSGNRGRCAQVCRLPYNDEYLLNLKDLCTLKILPDIIDTGVVSLKIEGRMKSPRYTAGVTSVYRQYIDKYESFGREGYKVNQQDIRLLNELFDRGGTTDGYFVRHNGKNMIFKGEKPSGRVPDEKLVSKIDASYVDCELTEDVRATAVLKAGEPSMMKLELSRGSKTYTAVAFGQSPLTAETSPLEMADVREKLSKFGGTGFALKELALDMDDDIFMPVSAINALRRDAANKLSREIINEYKRSHF